MAKGNAVEYTEKRNAFYQNISFMICKYGKEGKYGLYNNFSGERGEL